jgi:hypothetical protein
VIDRLQGWLERRLGAIARPSGTTAVCMIVGP